MPELNYLLFQDLLKELHELNKTLTGIRADLQNIDEAMRRDY